MYRAASHRRDFVVHTKLLYILPIAHANFAFAEEHTQLIDPRFTARDGKDRRGLRHECLRQGIEGEGERGL